MGGLEGSVELTSDFQPHNFCISYPVTIYFRSLES